MDDHLSDDHWLNELGPEFAQESSFETGILDDYNDSFVDNSYFSWDLAEDVCHRTFIELGKQDEQSIVRPKQARKTPARLARASVQVMESWLEQNLDNPYPTEEAKNAMKEATGLKFSQISTWFANARKRGKARPREPRTPVLKPSAPNSDFEYPAPLGVHPIVRWIGLCHNRELSSVKSITEALSTVNDLQTGILPDTNTNCWFVTPEPSSWDGTSISSLDIRSYGSDVESECIEDYAHSISSGTLTRFERRHQRNKQVSVSVVGEKRNFHCTFCPKSFKTKHDWQRHEKSQHLALEKWTCTPHGSVNVDPQSNKITCAFCNSDDPSPEHLQKHCYSLCAMRPLSERSFLRKDHLCQHLRLSHGDCKFRDSMKKWKSALDDVKSRCGFCGITLETWSGRVKHLAGHFVDGKAMSEWKGDWGLDKAILKVLENAQLPQSWAANDKSTDLSCPNQTLERPRCTTSTNEKNRKCHTEESMWLSCAEAAKMPPDEPSYDTIATGEILMADDNTNGMPLFDDQSLFDWSLSPSVHVVREDDSFESLATTSLGSEIQHDVNDAPYFYEETQIINWNMGIQQS